ncbi:unnamed protein product [Caenorhabditis auriculariae]|uniref:Uncharacterized protein n=1 Tax=Caenorhabditis auriculariae TaxID=2777116 RepID=A0A8S1HLE3_9PELO|nr:unnamed protein product [Caenorhabditis auriculariae]
MGFSPYLDECRHGFWPIQPACSKVISFGVFLAFTVLHLIIVFLPNPPSGYRRIDCNGHVVRTIPASLIFSVLLTFLLVCESIFYLSYVFYVHTYTHMLLAYCIAKLSFWLLSLCSLVRWRFLSHLPVSLALSFSAALLLDLWPITAWNTYFDKKTLKNGEFLFYVIETSLSSAVFFTALIAPSLGKESAESTWSGFSRKVSLIAPYVWPKKSVALQLRVAVCILLLIIGRLINVALPLYSKWIVDSLANPATFQYSLIFISTVLKFLQGNGAMGGFLNTLRTYLWIPIQQYTTRELEVELFAHLHSLSLRWHLSRKTGLVLRVMDRGTSSVNSILNYILFNIVPTIADIAIAVVFFFSTFNVYFGIIVFATMALYLVVTIYVTEWRTKFIRLSNEMDNKSSAMATDSLLNYETVKYYGNETYEVNRFRTSIQNYQDAEWKSQASLALLNMSQNAIIGVGLMSGSLLVAYLITVDSTLTVGDYVLFTTYILQLYSPLNFFGTVYRVIQKSFIDMENMFDLMNEEIEVKDSPMAITYQPTEGKITVKGLSFSYNPENVVLNDISFEVGKGHTVALVGPSGSGKSTMIRLLFRLFEAGNGVIEFDGNDVKDVKLASLRKQIGIVPQDTVLFNDTIKYNIKFGDPKASDEEIIEAAKAAMIHDKIVSLPDGYETLVGERGLKLSGGEKQRVAIARTILKKPQFIFLDEATSALDTHTERAIQRCLEQLCSSRTGVVVAHRLSTVVNADMILVLDKGKIIERGSHKALLAFKGVYSRMWASQNAERRSVSSSEPGDTPE